MIPPFDVTDDDSDDDGGDGDADDDDGCDTTHPTNAPIPHRASEGEADTDRDGFLSHPGEWHAATHGVYLGFTTAPWRHPPAPRLPDVRRESHYYRGGYVAGSLLQVVMLAVVAVLGLEHGLGIDVTGPAEPPSPPGVPGR